MQGMTLCDSQGCRLPSDIAVMTRVVGVDATNPRGLEGLSAGHDLV